MIKRLILIVVLDFLFLKTGNAQSSPYKELSKEWETFVQADDNEKDYRTNSFLSLLEQTVEREKPSPSITYFLKGWKETPVGSIYNVYITRVPFQMRPDRVFYCLRDNESNKAYAFLKEIDTKNVAKDSINVEGRLVGLDKDTLFSAKIVSGNETVFSIPDLKSAVLLAQLAHSRGDESAFSLADSLTGRLELVMKDSRYFEDNFSGFNGLSTLISPDNKMKIVTWNVEEKTGVHHFYGQVGVKDDNKVKVFRLKDSRGEIDSPEFSSLTVSKWYGAVYYELVPVKYHGDMYYTLLGYNGNDAFSKIRVVDVVSLSKRGTPKFGAAIFDINGRTKRRLVYEYSNQANMMLRYDDRSRLIVMDHLAPMEPMYQQDRSYYGPDFSYDALELNKGKWTLLKNVELRNR
jgi:hypothetical protein